MAMILRDGVELLDARHYCASARSGASLMKIVTLVPAALLSCRLLGV